jgi:integrase
VVHADFVYALGVLQTPRDRTMVELLWRCGLRRTDVAMLRLEDIDFVYIAPIESACFDV